MNDCGISKLDLKRRNRMQILRVVREQGPISRVDISSILQITRAAVTIITNEMIDQHILEEIGEEPIEPGMEVRKGRRKILLDINETYKFAIGVYIDEKELSIGLTTLNSAALDKKTVAHEGNISIPEILDLVDSTITTMLQNSCLSKENLLGIGVGIMPSMYQALGCESSQEGKPCFPELQEKLEQRTELPIYIDSAITQFAMAGIHYRESHAKSVNQVFLYWDDKHYCAIPMHGNTPLAGVMDSGDFVESLSVDPNGKPLDGYPQGSVRAELSPAALGELVSPLFRDGKTPELCKLLDGDLSRLTLAPLLTASETDTALQPIVESVLKKFCTMLHSLHCLYFTEYISLYRFGFTEQNLNMIRKAAKDFAGEKFAESILLSPIGDRYHFLCGCTYIIQLGFFQRGGLA
ncbi:MAG: hypothetical protein ACI4XB_04160 [Ruminococcus sp.]